MNNSLLIKGILLMIFKKPFQFVSIVFLILFISVQVLSQSLLNTFFLAAGIITVVIILLELKKKLLNTSNKKLWFLSGMIIGINILLLVWMNFHFQINDVGDPLTAQIKAYQLAHGDFNWHIEPSDGISDYFYNYPNTVMYTIFLSKIMTLGIHLGISVQLTLHIMTLTMLVGVIIFSLLSVWQINKNVHSVFMASIILLFLPVLYFYPNFVIYTDTLVMFLTTVLFYLISIILTSKKTWILCVASIMSLLTFAAMYLIKPNLIVLIIAALGMVICFFKSSLKFPTLIILVTLIGGFITAFSVTKPIENHYSYDQNSQALPITHWINMGLNPSKDASMDAAGSFSWQDALTARHVTQDNKKEMITESIKYRIKSLGISGLIKQFLNKAQILLGPRMFSYGRYQSGFARQPSLYAKHQALFDKVISILFTLILVVILLKVLIGVANRQAFNKLTISQQAFIALVLIGSIGLALFHIVLWEAQPRYFLPMLYPLVMLGSINFDNKQSIQLLEKVNTKTKVYVPMTAGILLIIIAASSRTSGKLAFGNFEYINSLELMDEVTLPKKMTVRIPITQDANELSVNIPAKKNIKVKLADGTELIPEKNHFILNKPFKKGQAEEVIIESKGNNDVYLYKELQLYKSLYHGDKTTIDAVDYYLPYSFKIYDKYPTSKFEYQEEDTPEYKETQYLGISDNN